MRRCPVSAHETSSTPTSRFQLDAVAAAVGLFDGQPEGPPEYSLIKLGELGALFSGVESTEPGAGRRLLLAKTGCLRTCARSSRETTSR